MNDTRAVLILRLRPARTKARATAEAEALHVLKDLGAERAAGGPLSEQAGVFWITIPRSSVEPAAERLPLLGYAHAVDLAKPVRDPEAPSDDVVVWRRRAYQLVRLYEESAEVARDRAPDRRVFALETRAGLFRPIRGYRGDNRPSKRRGLPSYDARMLVNLAAGAGGGVLVDPFAGVGGLVIEAVARGCRVVSCDADRSLRYGLTLLGASHVVADARRMPFASATFDALATEPPYEPEVTQTVVDSMHEGARLLRTGGRIAMLCAASQSNAVRRAAMGLPLALLHEEALDRKGLECTIFAWTKL